jgi:hypothetical protein
VRSAIAETAETVFVDQLTHEQQTVAQRIFIRLTELGDEPGAGDTRRRAALSELIFKSDEEPTIRSVLHALADARLITISEDSVDVAHEAIIREWPRLRGWLEENREGLRLHRHLTEASQEWSQSGRDPDLLYRGTKLAQASEWATTHTDELHPQEGNFLEASIALNQKETAERSAATARTRGGAKTGRS